MSAFFTILWENILSLLASILPASEGLPSSISDALTFFVGQGSTLGYIFPIGTLFSILILAVAFELGIFFFKIMFAVLSFVRGN